MRFSKLRLIFGVLNSCILGQFWGGTLGSTLPEAKIKRKEKTRHGPKYSLHHPAPFYASNKVKLS